MKLLNIGCGPVENGKTPGLRIFNVDKRAHPGATIADMENLGYVDNKFEVVVCVNALDHTPNAEKALRELIRVARDYVYIDCALIQKTTSGRGHYWDMLEDGSMTNGEESFNLNDYGFEIYLEDNDGERRYNHVIATLKK